MTTADGDRSAGVFAFSLFFRLFILNNHYKFISLTLIFLIFFTGLNLNRTDIDGLCGQLLEGKLLTVSDAQRCLKSIREKLTPEDYHEFLDIMKDFKEGRLDRLGVKEKVIKLCGTHQELLALFNIYLPEREKITFPQAADDVKKRAQLEVCMQYVEKVKVTPSYRRWKEQPEFPFIIITIFLADETSR
ncbi:putative transcription regulator Others family [Helianthus anomalus]